MNGRLPSARYGLSDSEIQKVGYVDRDIRKQYGADAIGGRGSEDPAVAVGGRLQERLHPTIVHVDQPHFGNRVACIERDLGVAIVCTRGVGDFDEQQYIRWPGMRRGVKIIPVAQEEDVGPGLGEFVLW